MYIKLGMRHFINTLIKIQHSLYKPNPTHYTLILINKNLLRHHSRFLFLVVTQNLCIFSQNHLNSLYELALDTDEWRNAPRKFATIADLQV